MESPSPDLPAPHYPPMLDIDVLQRQEMSANAEVIMDSGGLMDIIWQDGGAFLPWNIEDI